MRKFYFDVSDFLNHAHGLSLCEYGLLSKMRDLYIVNEAPMPANLNILCSFLGIKHANDKKVLHKILERFFVLDGDHYYLKIADDVIQNYQLARAKNKVGGTNSWLKRCAASENLKSTSSAPEVNNKQETINNNKEKNTKKEKPSSSPHKGVIFQKPDDVDLVIWKDFLKVRQAKKAPLTETALKKLRSEAEKANKPLQEVLEICITKNWQGFEAKWLIANDNSKPKPVFFNPNHAPPAEENVALLGIVNSNEANQLAKNIHKGTRL